MHSRALDSLRQYLSDPVLQLSTRGLEVMSKSKDPYHDVTHAERMLQDFSFMLKKDEHLLSMINPEVVVLSICWHDSWKAGRLARNNLELLYHQFWDGLGSVRIFERAAKTAHLKAELRSEVSYSIRKHAHFQFLPIRTLEAKILRDLDDLDLWSQERISRGKGIFAFASAWRVKIFRRTILNQKLNTDWAYAEREKRSLSFLEYFDALFQK